MKEGILKTCDKEKEKWYGNMVLLMKVNGNVTNEQEQHLIMTQMVRLVNKFGLKVECCTQ